MTALKTGAKIGDLFHHYGTLDVLRASDTLFEPTLPAVKLQTRATVAFSGYATFRAALLAQLIDLDEDAAGNPRLTSIDPDNSVDVVGVTTNLLKNVDTYGDGEWFHVPSGTRVDSPYVLESRIFENNVTDGQRHYGTAAFNLSAQSSYRIFRRAVVSAARTRAYLDVTGAQQVVTGVPQLTLAELALPAAKVMSGIHTRTVDEITNHSFFGDPALENQSDEHVIYDEGRLVLTPEGWVTVFSEFVRADILPDFSLPLWRGTTWYQNRYGRRYKLEALNGVNYFTLDHCVRFRKHGFGFGGLGKAHAAFYPPTYDRPIVRGYQGEVMAAGGGDFSAEAQQAVRTGVKLLRSVDYSELTIASNGHRFRVVGNNYLLDGLVQFMANIDTTGWYQQLFGRLVFNGGWGFGADRFIEMPGALHSMPLLADHYNAMAQAVNQLTIGRVLSWKCLKVAVGATIVDFDADTPNNFVDGRVRPVHWWTAFGTAPAPLNAFLGTEGNPYVEYALQQLGIEVSTGLESLPADWADFVHEFNHEADALVDYAGSMSGAGKTGERIFPDPPSADKPFDIYGASVTLTLGNWRLSPDRLVRQGEAIIAHPNGYAVALSSLPAVRWVSLDSFKTFCLTAGFPFLESEVFAPLKLDWLEFPTELASPPGTEQETKHFTGEVWQADQGLNDLPEQIAAILASLSANVSGTRVAGTLTRKQIAFRQVDVSADAEWKLRMISSVEGAEIPPRVFVQANRTAGHFFRTYGLQLGFSVFPLVANNQIADTADFRVDFPAFATSAPWARSYAIVAHQSGSTFPQTRNETSGASYAFVDGPYSLVQFVPPTEVEALARAEHYYSHLNNERRVLACQVTASFADPVPTQKFYLVPPPQWAVAVDWWEQDADHFFASFLGVATAPPRDVPATVGASVVTAGIGVTLITPVTEPSLDGAATVLYDPLALEVNL